MATPSLMNLVSIGMAFLRTPLTYEIITPELVGVKSNSLPLGKLSGRHAFVEKLKELALDFAESEINNLLLSLRFWLIRKNEVTDADIRALIAGTTVENPEDSDLMIYS